MRQAIFNILCVVIPVLCVFYWEIASALAFLLLIAWPVPVILFFVLFGVPKYPRLPRRR